jgi:hypothetical protein
MNDESIFEGSNALKEFKEEWLNVDTKGVLNETIENSAYIYKLLKVQEADDRLDYLHYLKNHYEGNFPCLMKELIHLDTMLSGKEDISVLKNQLDNGEISLDEYKEALKSIINK